MVEINTKKTTRKRVRRPSKELDLGVSRPIWNCLVVAVVGTIGIAFLLVQRHEERAAQFLEDLTGKPKARHLLDEKKPFIIYGTAWKEEKTAHHVENAIHAGFKFVDTAAQPKHYYEAGVGEGWTKAATELELDRSDLFLQTKFSPYQDKDPPYDPKAPLREQVIQSVKSSLQNLQTDYIDSLILHSPLRNFAATMTVWEAMEEFVDDGTVKHIGISNCYAYNQFKEIYDKARHKPWALQNRFYEDSKFDTKIRQFCKENNVRYQSFWTLTANRQALKQPEIVEMAKERKLTPQTLMFAFLMSLGYVTPLSGTTSLKHMEQDVDVMQRIQKEEVFFETEEELRKMAKHIGMPEL